MKVKALIPYKCKKLLKPCKKILKLFKFRFRRSLSIRSLQLDRHLGQSESCKTSQNRCLSGLISVLRSLKQPREMDRLTETRSITEVGLCRAPFSSPLTPAYIRLSRGGRKEGPGIQSDDVGEACRSFETYLVEMIVEEGKMRDLTDVEELLYCWKNLKCPVFIDLVCRFYGELCKDLFSNANNQQEEIHPNNAP